MWAASRGAGSAVLSVSIAVLALQAARPCAAQQAAGGLPGFTYEVVSIKPHEAGDGHTGIHSNDDSYHATNVSLKNLMVNAFDLKMESLVQGLSGPMADARFDINAKIDADTLASLKKLPPKERDRARDGMIRALLEDRFKLKVHRESKDVPVFALVVAKGGFKLKPADPNDTYPNGMKGPDGEAHAGSMRSNDTSIRGQGVPLSELAFSLQRVRGIDRVVLDRTGEPGTYDFDLHWVNEDHADDAASPAGVSLFSALEEQLGLKLESTRAAVETVVVDHVERPSED